jgi:murein DD-endopeptidase MepM/ murein hydrolase activator NlpD
MYRARAVFVVVLLVLGSAVAVVVSAGAVQAAGPRPSFQLPVSCGEIWRLATYVGHGDNEIDLTPTAGSAWGRPILASFGGTVVASGISGTLGDRTPSNPQGPQGTGGGYYVKLDHGGGWRTLYLHMLEFPMVQVGQSVAQGRQLGKVGSTGNSSGPHLHYEQQADGAKIESWFNGVPSEITHDNASYAVQRTSLNCSDVSHRLRRPDGSWTVFGSLGLSAVSTVVSAAGDSSGTTHVAVVRAGQVHHRVRYSDGTWSPWGGLGNPGTATGLAAAVDAAGVLHLAAVLNGQVHHRVRYSDGTWSPWGGLGNPGNAVSIGAAIDPSGNFHLAAVH